MRTIISPQNYIIVQFEKKFEELVKCNNGVILYKDVTFHPEEHVMMHAKVISIPRSIIKRADYDGYTELPAPGDIVLVRYDAIFDYLEQPDNANPIYRNCIDVDGQEFWRVDVMQVFAVQTPFGYRMLNGHVLCYPTMEDNVEQGLLLLPEYMKQKERKDRLFIRNVGPGPVQEGQTVYCNPSIVQEYRTYDDSFCIVKQSHLQAISL